MATYSEVVNVFANLTNALGIGDSATDLQNSIANGTVYSGAAAAAGIVAVVADVAQLPLTAVVAGSTGAELNLVQMQVILSSDEPLTVDNLAELGADVSSAVGNAMIAAGAAGAMVELGETGVIVGAVGTLATIALDQYSAVASAVGQLFSSEGKTVLLYCLRQTLNTLTPMFPLDLTLLSR